MIVLPTAGLTGTISDLTLSLNLNGRNNADLYAYLTGPNGGFAILLNRVEVAGDNPFGYQDTGFRITLSACRWPPKTPRCARAETPLDPASTFQAPRRALAGRESYLGRHRGDGFRRVVSGLINRVNWPGSP